jgi:hypothetical protein
MSARFVTLRQNLFSSFFIVVCGVAPIVIAQEESQPDTIASEIVSQDEPQEPIDSKVRRLLSKYESEVSFLLPEGEFDAALEKKIGHFSTQTRARYNFLRGEMGFSLQNVYARFRVVPQTQVYDRLLFVPIFEPARADRVWRREQGLQFGVRTFLFQPLNALTGFNYQRYSFPSKFNTQDLSSQQVHSLSQALGVQADSTRFLGFFNSGTLELAVIRAFPYGSNRANFWQLQLLTQGASETNWFSISGEMRLISMLDEGEGVPLSFLGGRNRLSAYDTNEFSGLNLFYVSAINHFHLNKQRPLALTNGFSLHETNLVMHTETGQIGFEKALRDFSSYRVSLGMGFNSVVAYRQRRAFELFFSVYKALEPHRALKYYFGVKY